MAGLNFTFQDGAFSGGNATNTVNAIGTNSQIGVTFQGDVPLPVVLTEFSAKWDEEDVLVTWQTATEVNNDYFEVLHSQALEEGFEVLSKIDGRGQSVELVNYDYRHLGPSSGQHFYRLRQVDFDGTSSLSQVVALEKYVSSKAVVVYPNPTVNGVFSLAGDLPISGSFEVELIDMTGKVILKKYYDSEEATAEVLIRIPPGTQPGTYVVQLKSEAGEADRSMLIVSGE